MAIGTTAAILGSAVIAGGATLAASKSSNKAISRATDAQSQATRESNALASRIYDLNTRNISPFMQRGNVAGDYMNALLGLPGGPTGQQQQPTPQPAQPVPQQQGFQVPTGSLPYFGNALSQTGFGQPAGAVTAQPQQQGVGPDQANNAFRQYIDNSDYAFRRDEMERGLGAKLSALGGLESGAAQKALAGYGRNLDAGYRGEYMNLLGGQQNVGLSGANALAGVGTNFANNVTNNNMANAHAIGQGAIARGANNANTLAGLGGIFGNAVGQMGGFGSSFGRPNAYGIAGSWGIY